MSSRSHFKSKFLRRFVLYGFLFVAYVLLGTTIHNANQEIKVSDYLMESAMDIAKIRSQESKVVIEREKKLTKSPDYEFSDKLKGKIVLQVESNGEAWYIDPIDLKRYYFGSPRETYLFIREKSKYLSGEEIFDYLFFEKIFPKELSGRFIANQDEDNEFYYVLPDSLLAVKINSAKEAFRLLKDNGVGISNQEIRKIEVGEY
ncbi:hypothetical protein C0584_03510 [Candidatus Parcubacteria bacterium]|nr:MAG: hypothetical protein C0584_03510 [Candidatus Parcubacteria bacterium]